MKTLLFITTFALVIGCSEAQDEGTQDTQAPPQAQEQTTGGADIAGGSMEPKSMANVSQVKGSPDSQPMRVVAKVNGKPIYAKQLMGRPLRNVINQEIIYQEAVSKGLDKDPEIIELTESYKKGLVASLMVKKILEESGAANITEAQIKQYYRENEDNYTRLLMKEVTTGSKKVADEFHQMVTSGTGFEEGVKKFQERRINLGLKSSKSEKSHIGYFPEIKRDAISRVTKVGPNYKVFQIARIRRTPLSLVSKSIETKLRAMQKPRVVADYAAKVTKESGIKVEMMR